MSLPLILFNICVIANSVGYLELIDTQCAILSEILIEWDNILNEVKSSMYSTIVVNCLEYPCMCLIREIPEVAADRTHQCWRTPVH